MELLTSLWYFHGNGGACDGMRQERGFVVLRLWEYCVTGGRVGGGTGCQKIVFVPVDAMKVEDANKSDEELYAAVEEVTPPDDLWHRDMHSFWFV